ncbi:methyltransferase [Marinobacter koreensis]|uniref:methyltransferase n=1 Tax=Marinobacter koreensis TaxID=335974 RepID=UPI0036108CEA
MITRSEGSAPGCRTGHEPTPSFYTRWECLNDWLASHAGFWRPAPFKTPSPQWEGRSPGLVRWLDALDPAALDYFDRHPAELASRIAHWVPGMADYPALTDLSAISPPEAAVARVTLDEVDATDMPGRKRAQAGAFAAAILPLNGPVLDWCCGKGHLTRTLARQCTAPVNGFEWDAALVEDGNRLAARFSDRLTIHCQDVMAPELRWPDVAHGVALHACGDLHRRLIAKGSDSQAPRISFSPAAIIGPCPTPIIPWPPGCDRPLTPSSCLARNSALRFRKRSQRRPGCGRRGSVFVSGVSALMPCSGHSVASMTIFRCPPIPHD